MPKQTDSIELTNVLQGTVEYTASQEIIPEEKILQQGEFSYTDNGTYTENPSEGYDGFSNVETTVDVQPELQEKSVSYTDNGDNVVEADDGYYGLSRVNVTVDVPQGGGTEAPENDVEFIDYDGTIVYSYTAQEFLALTEMPANPTHEGLTAQGWNWSLADAKTYVGDYGGLVIGQMYITDDGKTRVYLSVAKGATENVYLSLKLNGTVVVDWGDGDTSTLTGSNYATKSASHTYQAPGDYIATLTPSGASSEIMAGDEGSRCTFFTTGDANRSSGYALNITKIELGVGWRTSVARYLFSGLSSLRSISLPDYITSFSDYVFYACYTLRAVVLPKNATSLGNNFLSNSTNLERVSIGKDVQTIGGGCFSNGGLLKIYLSPLVTNLPDNVFNQCRLRGITIPSSVTSWGTNTFRNNTMLNKITIHSNTVGGNAFYGVTSFQTVDLKEGVQTIGSGAFQNCRGICSITFPSTLTQVGSMAFNACGALSVIKFIPATPPVLSSSSDFFNIAQGCKIYVPYSEDHSILNAYKTATNYPNPNTYTYVEY